MNWSGQAWAASQALTWARDRLFKRFLERSAVLDRREILGTAVNLETALDRGVGESTYADVRREFAQRAE